MNDMKISLGADVRLHGVDVMLDYLTEKGSEITWYDRKKARHNTGRMWPNVLRLMSNLLRLTRGSCSVVFSP